MRRFGGRFVGGGIAVIVAVLAIGALMLLWALPDANAFNAKVEQIFIENDDLTSGAEIKLLEILAQSGTAFSDTLASYRVVITVLLVFATAMLIAALIFLFFLMGVNRRMAQIERAGIQVNSLLISREENTVYLNNLGFKLTDAAMETRRRHVRRGNRGRDLRPQPHRLRRGGRRHPHQTPARHAGQSDCLGTSGQTCEPLAIGNSHPIYTS